MRDPRINKLALQVMGYSISLKKNEKVLIEVSEGSEMLALAMADAAYELGGRPYISVKNAQISRSLLMHADREQLEMWYECELYRLRKMDAYIAVRNEQNIFECSDVPESQQKLFSYYNGMLAKERTQNTKWCVLYYPNVSMAQMAGMSTEQFEDYYFEVCCIDYRKLNETAAVLNRLASQTDKVRIIAEDTDLTFSIKGMCQEKSLCGIFNIPCGETGMMVVPDSANGVIHYNIPSRYKGTVFNDIRFVLKNGVIVEATSDHTELLNQILDLDENARRIGEFSIGFHPFIKQPILNTLFDEKMEMSLHFTPGNSENNPSVIHWDIIQSHRPEYGGGEIWFDDVLIRKDGLFVPDELKVLNPENLKEILKENTGV